MGYGVQIVRTFYEVVIYEGINILKYENIHEKRHGKHLHIRAFLNRILGLLNIKKAKVFSNWITRYSRNACFNYETKSYDLVG